MRRTIHTRLTPQEFAWITAMREAARCNDKKPFETKGMAIREAIYRMNRLDNPSPRLWAYRCRVCGKWHLSRRE